MQIQSIHSPKFEYWKTYWEFFTFCKVASVFANCLLKNIACKTYDSFQQ